jgi:1,4-dihydroxy-2-naphthoate octaprenyltransferase
MHDETMSLHPGAARASRVRLWIRATRPLDILTSLLPGLAGGAVAINSGRATWWLLVPAMVALAFLHAGVNASNEVEDAARGVDGPDKMRGSRVFNTGLLGTREGRFLYGSCFAAAFVLGIVICTVQGPALLVIGVIGILGGLLYTAGPWPYKYVGLGEPAIVLLMGPLLTQGSYTAVTGDAFAAGPFWLGIGPGLLIACVLLANNIEDIHGDRAAGARTLAVQLGFPRARRIYTVGLLAIIPTQLVLWLSGLFNAWILVPLLITPLLAARIRTIATATAAEDPRLENMTAATAQVHLLFCALLALAVVLARAL